ncbi:DUF2971 domain-containing protein [Vibrio cholerae]|nr:DUF2971 domain-containing protein [Vibrio cholerae]EHY0954819.1 DUF2971 domain-containing protein [Vibrio cholerae]EJL6909111.1 DUF2971 domain-containing protein [Vibrio cholerae]EKF9161592.1 DUF2971 domain-containing protein [Vibrio cholerae]EKF9518851.1 DUF2971 domain-containing protein [Vibrio cholerae]
MRYIGEKPDDEQPLWRYFKVERLIDFLHSGELYFASAREFQDKFEGAIAISSSSIKEIPDHFESAFEELRRLMKISCWHQANHESDAMWQLYADKWRGVAIQTSVNKLITSIKPFRLLPEYGEEELLVGNVVYKDLINEKLTVSFSERFWFKHIAFKWENEFRLAISLRVAEEFGVSIPEFGIKVAFDIPSLIERIHLGPSLSEENIEQIIRCANEVGLGDKVQVSSLLGMPLYT